MSEFLSDDEIREVIRHTCDLGEMPEVAAQIKIVFVSEQQLPAGRKLASSSSTPTHQILLNKASWKDSSASRRLFVLRRECCYLMACQHAGHTVKREGAEYRYFAFKTETMEPSSEDDLKDDFTLLEPDQW